MELSEVNRMADPFLTHARLQDRGGFYCLVQHFIRPPVIRHFELGSD
jgi:hypothetical protein